MTPSESDDRLRPISYIVLGLLATGGPMTGYELEHSARISVGFFWPFPHSQIYAEPRRLERLGLVTVTEEAGGRRRRVYAVTEDGRAALRAWLA